MLPIVTPAEMAAIDADAPEPVEELIERAGAAVARAVLEELGGGYGRRVLVVAGKGNNGADGRAAARRLQTRGVRVTVLDAADLPAVLPAADLVVDAAYGTGFRGTWTPPRLPQTTPVVAVDLPSGLDGLTGAVHGAPWRATRTVTFAAAKPGLLLGAGPALCGRVTVADIGLDVGRAQAHQLVAADAASRLPQRSRTAHKWHSAVRVVAGSTGMTGAAHLATGAALRAGAGYVALSTPGSAADPWAPTEAVVRPLPADGWSGPVLEDLDRFAALAVGPGLGRSPSTLDEVRRLVAGAETPTVVDGDGLVALGADAGAVLRGRARTAGPVVLTPHDGEHEALTGHRPDADRLEAARALAAETGAVVLLKGPATVIADPEGWALVVTAGDARLATAGTGDVLTGIIAALLAGGLPARFAAGIGALLHGAAGDLAWAHGLVASDLVRHLPAALRQLNGV